MLKHVPVSVGELLDKISILEIKTDNITDATKLDNVKREHEYLIQCAVDCRFPEQETELKRVNQQLWIVEDKLRELEKQQDFGIEFVELARSVYKLNDLRAEIKKQINLLAGSVLIEEKSYENRTR